MRKTLKTIISSQHNRLGIFAAVALAASFGLHGCTTNPPAYGEPAMSAPAAGSYAPNATSTPGSAHTMGTMPLGPNGMTSSLPASGESLAVDAIAIEKADEGFRGKVLGPAPLGDNSVTPGSMQQVTGQFISPSLYANPQVTVNSSISSAPTPAIVSGAGEPLGGAAVAVVPATTGVVAGTAIPATAGTTAATPGVAVTAGAVVNGVQNVGVTGMSNTTATPITNANAAANAAVATPTAATPLVNTGIAVAPGVASNVVATPILSTVGPGVLASNAGGSVLGVTNVTTTPNATAAATVTTGVATAPMSLGVGAISSGVTTPTFTAGQVSAPATLQTGAVTAQATAAPARTRAANQTTTTAGVRVVTASNGAVVVTNQSQSSLQQFLSVLGLRRNLTANATSGTPRQ